METEPREDKLLPTHNLGYAINKENYPMLAGNGMPVEKMFRMIEANGPPDPNTQANPMDLVDPLNQGNQGACFPAGTKITLATGELKNIEDVQFGETVLTHKGRCRQVIDVMSRSFSGELYRVFVKGWGAIRLTNDHVVRVHREGELAWLRADELRETDKLVVSNGIQSTPLASIDLADYVGNLYSDGDKISSKSSPGWVSRFLQLDALTCYILGLYCAEGSTDRTSSGLPNRACFTLHEDKTEDQRKVEEFSRRIEAGFTLQTRRGSKAVNCRVASPVLARFLELVCGRFCNNKKVPEFVMFGSSAQKMAFIRGYFSGDGSRAKYDAGRELASGTRVKALQINSSTSSRVLSQQVASLMVSIGMKPGRTLTKVRSHQRYDSYQTFVYSGDACRILGDDYVPTPNTRSQFKEVCEEGQLRSIRTIEHETVADLPVYDFTVDEDHSFVAQGLVVHNCQGHSLATCFTLCYFLATGRIEAFSRAAGYYLSQRVDGIRGDRGSTLSAGMQIATKHGLCLEKDWPYPRSYDPTEPRGLTYPFKLVASQPTSDYSQIEHAIKVLGLPVQDGIIWDNSVSRSISTDYVGSGGGGHSTTLFGMIGQNFRRINSWGMWDGDGCNENTPRSLKKQVEHRYSSHIIYAPAGMIYPELSPVG